MSGGPKKPQYEPRTPEQALGYLVEEAGEVLAAAGKSLRWGLDSSNPELPEAERENNAAWLARELLEAAIVRVRRLCALAEPAPEKAPAPNLVGELRDACERALAGISDWRLGSAHHDEGEWVHMTASEPYLRSVLDSLNAALARAKEGR